LRSTGRNRNFAARRSESDYARGKKNSLIRSRDIRCHPPHRRPGRLVGGKEEFERKFGQSHLDGTPKDGG